MTTRGDGVAAGRGAAALDGPAKRDEGSAGAIRDFLAVGRRVFRPLRSSCFARRGGLQWRPPRRVGDLPANRQGAVSLSRPPDARGAPAWVLSPGWRVFAPAKGQAGAARAALAHGRSCRQWTAVLEAMAWGMAWRSDAFPLPRETDVQSSAKSRRPTGPKGGLSPPILQIRCDTAGGWLIRGRLGHRGNSLCSWTNTERNIPRADAYRLSDQCRP